MAGIDLRGCVALVTGASLGIGRATAIALGKAGAKVGVNYRSSQEKAQEVVDEIRKAGSDAILLPADVADQSAVEKMVAETAAKFGKLDIAVSNAAYSDRDRFFEADMAGFRRTVDVTMWGAFYLMRAATQQMIKHPERSKQSRDNATYFVKLLKERGINTGMTKDTAVVPAIVGNSVLALQLSDSLKKRGINVQPILYPAVEEDQARLRFFLSSLHHEAQLLLTANVLKEELERLTREMNGDAVA